MCIGKHTVEHYQSWITLLNSQTLTLSKQYGIIFIGNATKGRRHPEKSFYCPSGSLLEFCLMYFISMYAFRCFNKLLHVFPLLLEKHKKNRLRI